MVPAEKEVYRAVAPVIDSEGSRPLPVSPTGLDRLLMPSSSSDISVVIPHRNRADLLDCVIGSLRRQTVAPSEILVVDTGSIDTSVERAEQLGAKVLRLETNAGFCRAVNCGVEASRGDLVAIVNNDVELDAAWVEQMALALRSPDTWFATGKILNYDRGDIVDGTYDALSRGACAWRLGHGRSDGPGWSDQCQITFASLTAAAYRKELFLRVGGLDESFEMYLEDVELGLRCAAAGCKGVYVPQAVARHRGSATLGAWHPDAVRRISRNQLLLVAKHYPEHWIRDYGWPVFVGQALWGLLAATHGGGWPWMRGKWEALRAFRRLRISCADTTGVREILDASEKQILAAQQRTGFDLYWRLYFGLT